MKKNILIMCKMGDTNADRHVLAILNSDLVDKATLIRYKSLSFQSKKLEQIIYGVGQHAELVTNPLIQLWGVFLYAVHGFLQLKKKKFDYITSFTILPYGLVSLILGKLFRVPVSISMVGEDFNYQVRSRWLGPVLLAILKRFDAITVYGNLPRQYLIERGFAPAKIWVLPHAIDINEFTPKPEVNKTIDVIFIGKLIPRKRIHLLLQAFQLVLEERPRTSLCIVGRGPERARLMQISQKLGINREVKFLGFVDSITEVLNQAKIFVNLGAMEGVPFAVIEAICMGSVVIATDVGGTNSVVLDGKNGYLICQAMPEEIAKRILEVLNDEKMYQQMSAESLKLRNSLSYDKATAVWDVILQSQGERK